MTTIEQLPTELGIARTARKAHRCTCADADDNPNYRPDCLGDIAPGDRYWEYVGDAVAFQSGSAYCIQCAVEVWASFIEF